MSDVCFLLGKRDSDGTVGVYTGRASDGWFNEAWDMRFKMTRELAERRAAQFDEHRSLHGIHWVVVEEVPVEEDVVQWIEQ